MSKSGVTPICRECARKIALKIRKDKVEHQPDKASVQLALRYLNKPFLEKVWDSSVQEAENLASGKVKSNVCAQTPKSKHVRKGGSFIILCFNLRKVFIINS